MSLDDATFIGGVQVTPQLVADLFWGMASDEQADFFAALERQAGVKLCFQMVAVVDEISARSDNGDHEAMHGFQTMLAHAQAYAEEAIDCRIYRAKAELRRMRRAALETLT